ncbi:putative D-isomer specific 2-hydroxyacid dehydrogenase family protein, partial [Teratosphaeria destructans]
MMTHVSGKVLGVVGLGKLGAQMARTGALGFGMEVVAWSEHLTPGRAEAVMRGSGVVVRVVGKEELFRCADVVSLHVVLGPGTRGVVGARELGWMKRTAVLVNTARAGLVEEEALRAVLREGRIRGACLDVWWEEPLPAESEWRGAGAWQGEVLMSPHMGYVTAWQMHRWYQEQKECVERWLAGEDVGERRMN